MAQKNVSQSSTRLPKLVFKKPVIEYIREFWFLIFLYAAVPTLFEFILNLIQTGKIQGQRINEVVQFIQVAKPIWFALLSYFVSRKLFANWARYEKVTFLQGVVVGVSAGIVVGIFLSIFEFAITFFQGNLVDSIIALISFLWNSWKYVFNISIFILIFLIIQWVINNFTQLKEMVSQEEAEIDKPQNNENTDQD